MAVTSEKIPRCSSCNVSYSVIDQEWQHDPTCLIARQAHGEPIVEASSADLEMLADPMPREDNQLLRIWADFKTAFEANYEGTELRVQERPEGIEVNFDFYIDGFTIGLSGPDDNSCTVTHPDGRSILLKRASLTGFLERRFEPAENDGNLTG